MRLGKTFFGLVLALVLLLPGPAWAASNPTRATQVRGPESELVQGVRADAPQHSSVAGTFTNAGVLHAAIAHDARTASENLPVHNAQLVSSACLGGGPPGADEIQYDDGSLANAWFFPDRRSKYAVRMDPPYQRAVIAQCDIHVLTNGDPYWPWPDYHHDSIYVEVWFDDNGDGLPDFPEVWGGWAQDRSVEPDTATIAVRPPLGSVVCSTASFWVGMMMDTLAVHQGAGYEGVGIDVASEHPGNQFYYWPPDGSWQIGPYYSGDFMFRAWTYPWFADYVAGLIDSPCGRTLVGDTITPRVQVMNLGADTVERWVWMRIEHTCSTDNYLDSAWMQLPSMTAKDTFYRPWVARYAGLYRMQCTANRDDSIWSYVNALSVHAIDVAVTAIVEPRGGYDTISLIAPSARVANLGSFPISFEAFFAFNSTPAYSESISINSLSPGTESLVTFPAWAKPHAYGGYATHCSVYAAGDGNASNDARTGSFSILPGPGKMWGRMADLPSGSRHKSVKGGGALAYQQGSSPSHGLVYAFKGNNTCEFYRYSVATSLWVSRDSIPAIGRSGKTKGARKGSSLTFAGDGKLYATKGNHTCEFWRYDPNGAGWTEMVNEVPIGGPSCREGTSTASVTVTGTNYVYLLKGSGTFEFYRYDADAGTWATMANAPRGSSGKPYRDGSSITSDGGDTIYCLKGSYNEFFAYSIGNDRWVTLETLPRRSPLGTRKTKAREGSGIAFMDRKVYASKGGNTNEFWTYLCDSHRWCIWMDIPAFRRKVKDGGALVAVPDDHDLYALRGNNTLEFWEYGVWGADGLRLSAGDQPKDVQGQSTARSPQFAISITSNPFTTATAISYCLPRAGNIRLRLYDVTGKLVSTLASGYHPAGSYSFQLTADGSLQRLAAGIYVLRLDSEGNTTTQKLVIE